MAPRDLEQLAAALQVPFGASREHDLFASRGGRRTNAEGAGIPRRISLLDYVLALRLRDHLNLPLQPVAVLLGADRATVGRAAALARRLLTENRIPLPAAAPPPAAPPRTPGELLRYAAAAGIDLTIPDNSQPMPSHFRTRRSGPRHARS
jgi:hypothetical protein